MGAAAADRYLPAELAGADAVFGLAWCPPTALTGGGPPVGAGEIPVTAGCLAPLAPREVPVDETPARTRSLPYMPPRIRRTPPFGGLAERDGMACRVSCGYHWTADDPGWRAQVLPAAPA